MWIGQEVLLSLGQAEFQLLSLQVTAFKYRQAKNLILHAADLLNTADHMQISACLLPVGISRSWFQASFVL